MSSTENDDNELSPGWRRAMIVFYLVMALCFTHLALHEPSEPGFARFITPLLLCYVAAFQCVQLARLKSGQSLQQPPPLVFRYIGLAFCVAITYSPLALPDKGFIRILWYIGLAAFWGLVLQTWRDFNKQDQTHRAKSQP